jgi:hypothetical protein
MNKPIIHYDYATAKSSKHGTYKIAICGVASKDGHILSKEVETTCKACQYGIQTLLRTGGN